MKKPPTRRPRRFQMKKPPTKPTESKCPACNGTGYPVVIQPVQPGRKIYPAPCKKCGGKGRLTEAANAPAM
jgi:DnaJ-class molecular chaperone